MFLSELDASVRGCIHKQWLQDDRDSDRICGTATKECRLNESIPMPCRKATLTA
jgi:hypothetical protein